MAHRAAAGTSPKRTTGGPQTGGRPHPAAGPLGGPPPGEVGLGAGGARTQARPPTPRPGGHSQRPGHRPTAERPGGGAAAPRTQAASNETGRRPTTGRGPRRQPPAHTNGGEGPRAGAGQGRAAAMGRGRPGRASTGPACTRPAAYLLRPRPPPPGAGGDNRHGGGPGRRALCARGSGRAEGPRGGRIRSRGHPSRSWGGVGGKKNGRWAFPPAGHDWTKKCGEDALSPPLAVTADTRYPPVRRSSPRRTRCRPVPCALAMRRLPRPPSCLP